MGPYAIPSWGLNSRMALSRAHTSAKPQNITIKHSQCRWVASLTEVQKRPKYRVCVKKIWHLHGDCKGYLID